jgi:predicted YcjX-like family ATPase
MAKSVQDFDELYPGRFIKAGDLKGRDWTLTIARVVLEELEGTKKQSKGVIAFRETQKELVLNRTNGECIKAMFGRKLADWTGKRITIYPANIQSDLADIAIRIKGSPDLAQDVAFTLSLARKKPRQMTLKKTSVNGKATKPAPTPEPEETPEPEPTPDADGDIVDQTTGEVFPA